MSANKNYREYLQEIRQTNENIKAGLDQPVLNKTDQGFIYNKEIAKFWAYTRLGFRRKKVDDIRREIFLNRGGFAATGAGAIGMIHAKFLENKALKTHKKDLKRINKTGRLKPKQPHRESGKTLYNPY